MFPPFHHVIHLTKKLLKLYSDKPPEMKEKGQFNLTKNHYLVNVCCQLIYLFILSLVYALFWIAQVPNKINLGNIVTVKGNSK